MESGRGGVAQHSQPPRETAGVVTLVLQTGPVEGEVTQEAGGLLLPPAGDPDPAPLRVLVQHHLLALPGRPEGPDNAGELQRAVPHLTPQLDLATLGEPQSNTQSSHI